MLNNIAAIQSITGMPGAPIVTGINMVAASGCLLAAVLYKLLRPHSESSARELAILL